MSDTVNTVPTGPVVRNLYVRIYTVPSAQRGYVQRGFDCTRLKIIKYVEKIVASLKI
jgi:hypothetical protein